MNDVKDYVSVTKLNSDRDYDALNAGGSFVILDEHHPTAVIQPQENAKIISLIHFAKAQWRGNHYHHNKTEYLTVLKGKLLCHFSLKDDQHQVVEYILEAGDQVQIKPSCIHKYKALDDDAYALEYATEPFKFEDNVYIES